VKYLLFLPDLRELEISLQTSEIYTNIIFHKNRPVEAALFHEDRRADMTKLIVAFRSFAEEPKTLTFTEFCIVIYSYNESQQQALFLKFILLRALQVSDRSTFHHQESQHRIHSNRYLSC